MYEISPWITVIREVYDSENSHETFEFELDNALDIGSKIIVVEPTRLGDETARWIAVGNCLHKTAVISGIASISSGLIWTDKPYCQVLGIISVLCTGLYTVAWQFDPCCQYQVETDEEHLRTLPVVTTSTVVLVRKDTLKRNTLHATVSILAAVFCGWQLYFAYK